MACQICQVATEALRLGLIKRLISLKLSIGMLDALSTNRRLECDSIYQIGKGVRDHGAI